MNDAPHSALPPPAGARVRLLVVAVLTVALCWPFRDTVGWLGDEGVLLHGADRMLRGERLYGDFFEFLPPLGFMLAAAWLKLTTLSFAAARWLAILVIAAIACLLQAICRRMTPDPRLPTLAALAWVVMSQGAWTQLNHHWFTTLFSLAALWAALRGTDKPGTLMPLLAGVFAGAAGMSTSTRGALAALATAASCLPRPLRLVPLAIGIAVVPAIAILHLAAQSSLLAAFQDVIVFPATSYADIQPVPFGARATPQNLPLVLLFPAAALLTAALCLTQGRAAWRDARLLPCASFALAGFIGCYPRPDDAHIIFAAPLAMPLFVLCAGPLAARIPRLPRAALATLGGGLLVAAALNYAHVAREGIAAPATAMPRGTVKLMHGTQDAWAVLAANIPAHAADGYLFYPYAPLLPFLSGLRHVAPYDVYTPHYSTPRHYAETCRAAMARADWLVIDRGWTGQDVLGAIFPALRDSQPPEVIALERALDLQFEPAARHGTWELRRRLPGATTTACDSMPG